MPSLPPSVHRESDIAVQTLSVIIEDQLAGEIVRDNGHLTYHYLPSYQRQPGATPLSLSMPLAVDEHPHRVVEPYLWGLLPDNQEVLRTWGRQFGVSAGNPFSLLGEVGRDCAGAVQFVDSARPLAPRDDFVTWLDTGEVAQRLALLRREPTAWQRPSPTGQWSLGGAQSKLALLMQDGRWGQPNGAIPTTHILKPAIAGLADHDLNEHLCLDLARRLGLTAAASDIREFDSERVICVTRYDRVQTTVGWRRVHQEDLCQALAVPPRRKYQNEGGPSVEQIAAVFRRHLSTSQADVAVAGFVDALALNWFVAGTDAHAKNYSVLLSGSAVRLAPLYDVASYWPYDESAGHRIRLPMKIGGQYDSSYLGWDNWETLARGVRLSPEQTVARLVELARAVPDALSDACAAPAVRGLRSPMPGRLLDLVAAHTVQCLSRLVGPAPPRPGQTAWSPGHAQALVAELGEPQRILLVAVVEAAGEVAAADLQVALGGSRTSLRGLTGPVTKALHRLQRQNALPDDLPRPLQTRYATNNFGTRRVEALTMTRETLAAFRAALG